MNVMERKIYSVSELKEFIGKPVTEECLLGRNYFYCEKGQVTRFNDSYVLSDFKFGVDEEDCSMKPVCEDTAGEFNSNVWIKRLPVQPEDSCEEAYIIIKISLNEKNEIRNIKCYIYIMYGIENMLCLTPEVLSELNALCEGKYLPKDFSFIGKKVTENLKSVFHLNNAGCDYSLHVMSAFRYVTTSIFINVDENDCIKEMTYATNGICSMFERPQEFDTAYSDLLDALILMHDNI